MKPNKDYRISSGGEVLEIRYDQSANDHQARRDAVLRHLGRDWNSFQRIILMPERLFRMMAPRKRKQAV